MWGKLFTASFIFIGFLIGAFIIGMVADEFTEGDGYGCNDGGEYMEDDE